jgi:RimJ/RimL family protein N-acetyltransferase
MIVTDRLTLRRARMTDLGDIHAMLSHPAAMRCRSTPEHETRDQSRKWLAGMVAGAPAEDDTGNKASHRLLGRLGFVETGRADCTMRWRNDWCDRIHLALRRPAQGPGILENSGPEPLKAPVRFL